MPPEREEDILDAFFDQVLDAFRAEDVPSESARKLANLRALLLDPKVSTMAATEFTIDEAVFAFGLEFSGGLVHLPIDIGESLKWRIEDIPQTKGFVLTPGLRKSFKHSVDSHLRRVLLE